MEMGEEEEEEDEDEEQPTFVVVVVVAGDVVDVFVEFTRTIGQIRFIIWTHAISVHVTLQSVKP